MARSRVVDLANFQQFTAINVLSDPGAIGGPKVIPNCVEVVLNWLLADLKTAHNVLHGSVTGSFTPTATIAQAIFAGLSTGAPWTGFAGALSTSTKFTGVTLRDLRTANGPLISSTGALVPGTDAGIALPNEVAICATLRTNFAGRANRGRLYLGGISTVQVQADNTFPTAVQTAINTWLNNVAAVLSAQGITWAIAQPARNGYTGSTGTIHPARAAGLVPVTSQLVRDNHWDSQRRRGLK